MKRRMDVRKGLLGAAAAALLLGAAPTLGAQTATPSPPSGVPQEGVKVHGRWVIEVRNPDGTRVSRTEFNNALTSSGMRVLAQTLAGDRSMGRWYVLLDAGSSNTTGRPCGANSDSACVIYEGQPVNAGFPTTEIAGINLTRTSASAPTWMMRLAGTATATANGSIARVSARAVTCPNTVSPADAKLSLPPSCPYDPFQGLLFSETGVTAIPIVKGQLIQVTVTYTFGS